MSNRRRTGRVAPPDHIKRTAVAARCPDCDSDVSARIDDSGIWHISIAHDNECPQLAWRQRNNLQHQVALTTSDGSPVPADAVAAITDALTAEPGTRGVLATLVPEGGTAAPGWAERDAIEQLMNPEQP